jgi:3'-phosphoadenosine 5'-phosphosulfate (PAPS) 3'-phosphatase
MLNIIEGNAEIYFRNKGISKWDLCAGEALLLAYGGKMLTLNNGELQLYDNNGDPNVYDGSIAFFDKNFLSK